MITALILSNWKRIAVLIAVVGVLSMTYLSIYNRGYNAATVEYRAREEQRAKDIAQRVEKLQDFITGRLDIVEFNSKNAAGDIKNIYVTLKNKGTPLTNIPCTPSPAFVGGYNDIVERANR